MQGLRNIEILEFFANRSVAQNTGASFQEPLSDWFVDDVMELVSMSIWICSFSWPCTMDTKYSVLSGK